MGRFAWRDLLRRAVHLWRGSLQLRTIAITLALSGIAVSIIGAYISSSVQANLFTSRRDQVIAQAGRATLDAENQYAGVGDLSQPQDLDVAQVNAQQAISEAVASPSGTTLVAIIRVPGQGGASIVNQFYSPGFNPDTMVTSAMRRSLADDTGGKVYSQPLAIPTSSGHTQPGIITGSVLDIPSAGRYALYLVFNLSDAQNTLNFVQQTIAFGGIALVVLIGLVAYTVVRLVIGPVRVAAATSEKLADGQLEERLPERGEDVLATLARSFNRMADSMQQQIRQLGDLSRLQQRFVSDVSHELRTPLTTIRLAGDVLYESRDEFDAPTARTAELLHTQTMRFEVLLADLLEMSRYDAGAVQLEPEPTNLVRLVEDAIDQMTPLAEERGSQLRLVAPGGYFEAEVDARRIRRILQNLLGNAIDHGEGRPIVVHVDSDAQAVAIAVRDYGVGMTASDLERVFDRFWRADPSRQRRTGGTGLGLAISLEDTTLHDGALEVWSEPGVGSCFRLTLPRVRGQRFARSPLALPPDDPSPVSTPDDAAPTGTEAS